jgi:hypothetical protein
VQKGFGQSKLTGERSITRKKEAQSLGIEIASALGPMGEKNLAQSL